jgi:hypothetical protein
MPGQLAGHSVDQLSAKFEARESSYTNVLTELADCFLYELSNLHAGISNVLLLGKKLLVGNFFTLRNRFTINVKRAHSSNLHRKVSTQRFELFSSSNEIGLAIQFD